MLLQCFFTSESTDSRNGAPPLPFFYLVCALPSRAGPACCISSHRRSFYLARCLGCIALRFTPFSRTLFSPSYPQQTTAREKNSKPQLLASHTHTTKPAPKGAWPLFSLSLPLPCAPLGCTIRRICQSSILSSKAVKVDEFNQIRPLRKNLTLDVVRSSGQ